MYLFNLVKILHGIDSEQHINLLHCFSPSDANRIYYGKHLKWNSQASIQDIAPVRRLVQQDIAAESDDFSTNSNGLVFAKTNWFLGKLFDHSTIDFSIATGALYIVRNPLDVAVSLAHHMNAPIDSAIDFMCTENAWFGDGDSAAVMTGSWSHNVKSWTQNPRPDICVVRYEDLLADAELWFNVLTRHIFRNHTPAAHQIRQAIERCSFEHLQAQEQIDGYVHRPRGIERFFREGRAEQWKDALTREQVVRIVDNHREQMERFGYIPAE
jgi:Sulfotransferase domain